MVLMAQQLAMVSSQQLALVLLVKEQNNWKKPHCIAFGVGLGLDSMAAGDDAAAGLGLGLDGTALGDSAGAGIGLGLDGTAGEGLVRHGSWRRSRSCRW